MQIGLSNMNSMKTSNSTSVNNISFSVKTSENSKHVLVSVALCLILLATSKSSPAFAQLDIRAEQSNSSVQQTDSFKDPLNFSAQHGTSELQLKVLKEINHDLQSGSLTPEEASDYKAELNKINDSESGYQSIGHLIPMPIVERNTIDLQVMGAKLHRATPLKTSGSNALHYDVDDMISRALARNKITSSEAERYYLRLAQIESNMESAKTDKASGADDAAAMAKSLAQLRAELSRY
jgi:hypothetical protein